MEKIIYDGEVLDYECLECGNSFERIIGYGCCRLCAYARKEYLQKYPTICPKCNSRNVERIRGKGLGVPNADIATLKWRKIEEWDD